jgi:CelD/BcsL family acetyltransferase involved in cellulose biosynthesis
MQMAGNPISDYTGMLCLPQYEQPAIAALASHLKLMDWDLFSPRDVYDPRVERLLRQMDGRKITVQPAGGNLCHYIPLPPTWEQYLSGLRARTRERIRQVLRNTDADSSFRLVRADQANFTTQVDAHLKVWQSRRETQQPVEADRMRAIYRKCLDCGCLQLIVLWHDDTPVAGQASLIDKRNKALYLHSTGFDQAFASLAVGKVVNAHTIKSAIEMGFTTCDFLRGDERYKSEMGAKQIRSGLHFSVARRTFRTTIRKAFSTIGVSL